MKSLLPSIYQFILAPLLRLAFHLVALGNEKIRRGLHMRRLVDGRAPWQQGASGTRPIWIHCASGEFEYAKPIIRELKARRTDVKIFVTYFSPSIAGAVAKFPGVDFHSPSPWENASDVRALIEHHRPRALLIARTDTWPVMLQEAKRTGVPTLLFSATLSKSAGRLHPLMRAFSNWAFSLLDEIFVVTEDDKRNFKELGVDRAIQVAGDTRFDQVIARLSEPKPIKNLDTSKPILVAGSTWDEDEVVLVPVIKALANKVSFVIAPHEPTPAHIMALRERLRAHGLEAILYSESNAWPDNAVMIVDQVGILAELYTKGRFAFVGGSFRKTVHSVMEPLGAGCITFVGPLHLNNREALEFKTIALPANPRLTCVTEVQSSSDWIERLNEALLIPSQDQFIRGQIQSRSGRSGLVVDWVLKRI